MDFKEGDLFSIYILNNIVQQKVVFKYFIVERKSHYVALKYGDIEESSKRIL